MLYVHAQCVSGGLIYLYALPSLPGYSTEHSRSSSLTDLTHRRNASTSSSTSGSLGTPTQTPHVFAHPLAADPQTPGEPGTKPERPIRPLRPVLLSNRPSRQATAHSHIDRHRHKHTICCWVAGYFSTVTYRTLFRRTVSNRYASKNSI